MFSLIYPRLLSYLKRNRATSSDTLHAMARLDYKLAEMDVSLKWN